ncbi:hypothetical protein F2Q69_00020070 [Brassica cretica]|uniref:Uncharacterized protein n=1 Tax=Brassica cretica TaxID=69181 RepID=A0A8S9Q024_BRACR|nr:hypothetical protein F2Q69_00020070 [Brassica cretica]
MSIDIELVSSVDVLRNRLLGSVFFSYMPLIVGRCSCYSLARFSCYSVALFSCYSVDRCCYSTVVSVAAASDTVAAASDTVAAASETVATTCSKNKSFSLTLEI